MSIASYPPSYPKPRDDEQSANAWGDYATQHHPNSDEYAEAMRRVASIATRNGAQYAAYNQWPISAPQQPTTTKLVYYPPRKPMMMYNIPQHQRFGHPWAY